MRDYVFHGKRVDNGEWVDGMPCSDLKGGVDAIQSNIGGGIFDIYPESFGQYTGMSDIKSQRIFEGDIMETAICGITYHRGVVEFTDGSFGLRCIDGSAYFLCFVAGNYSIIGNVFENADLLEG